MKHPGVGPSIPTGTLLMPGIRAEMISAVYVSMQECSDASRLMVRESVRFEP